jgi:hypothetical protein
VIRALALAAALAGVSQPPQPKAGPGGGSTPHAGVRVTAGGSGAEGWYVFEPVWPRPRTAPLAIVTHGYYEFSGYASVAGLIRHSVVHDGDVVIYPRWQTAIASPCPGPFDIGSCLRSEVAGIRGALAYLRADRRHRVQPDVRRTSYFGFSFGGIVTADVLNHWRRYGVPRPRAVFLDDPHDGGLIAGKDEPALDASLAGIPSSTLFECHSGADGVISEPGKAGMSCNALFPRLTSIPARRRELVMTHTDAHGSPALSSGHGVCASGPHNPPNAYDWSFCWRDWDALQAGRLLRRRSLGRWSDGTPVTPLTIA